MMKKAIRIELPDDFCTACEIFGLPPEEVIQEFTRRVSLPVYFSEREDRHRWATLFFLDYIDHLAPKRRQPEDIHEKYMHLLNKRTETAKNSRAREKAGRQVLLEWRKAVKERKKG